MKSILGGIFVKSSWLWSERACQANLALVVAPESAQLPISHCFSRILFQSRSIPKLKQCAAILIMP